MTSAVRIGLATAAMTGVFAALLFVPAGRLGWTAGWLYLSVIAIYMAVTWVCLLRWNPVLIERRMHMGKGTKTWDIVWAVAFTPLMAAIYVVAGLDARGEHDALDPGWWATGLLIFAAGAWLLTWSMVVNPFFEKTVRIQTDHAHRVVDTGPYRYVRHPGYVGFIGWLLATPSMLASGRAFIPALLAVIAVVVRTALEDRTLRAELPGYADYAARVRYRLIPGIW